MDEETLLAEMEKLAERLGVEVKVGKFDGKGGLAKWKGQWVLVVDRGMDTRSRLELFAEGLSRLNTSDVFVLPAVRDALDRFRPRDATPMES